MDDNALYSKYSSKGKYIHPPFDSAKAIASYKQCYSAALCLVDILSIVRICINLKEFNFLPEMINPQLHLLLCMLDISEVLSPLQKGFYFIKLRCDMHAYALIHTYM